MEILTYCRQVALSDQTVNDPNATRILFLGLIGEIGSLLSECKKTLREGEENRSRVKEKLIQEMGDSLWYISAIASYHNLDLRTDIIRANIDYIQNLKICHGEIADKVKIELDKMPNRLPLDFDEYQKIAWMTASEKLRGNEDDLLARLIKNASHLMRYIASGRLIDRDATVERLERMLGDVIWYIAVFAEKKSINLNYIAQSNYNKTVGRWYVDGLRPTKKLDSRDKIEERFPDKMSFTFRPNATDKIEITYDQQDIKIGNELDDNTYIDDGYRYHDAFHLAFAAILTWSPVLRKTLRMGSGRKLNKGKNFHRFHDLQKASAEDGARAQIVEEAIAKIVHSHASDIDAERLLADKTVVSTEILDQIKIFTGNLEVDLVNQWEWEKAIIEACKIFLLLRENDGGRVILDLKNRSIKYETIE